MKQNNDQQLVSELGLKAASFANGIQRELPVQYIVEMISRCIKEEKKITINEIVDCWIDVKLKRSVIGVFFTFWNKENKWDGKWMLKDEMKEKQFDVISKRAISWFMNNLGAAIIKGRLLVIPVIDIETEAQYLSQIKSKD